MTSIPISTQTHGAATRAPAAPAALGASIISRLFATPDDKALVVVRFVLGALMFLHGTQKVFGWFGGYGFTGTMGFFTSGMHIPYVFGVLAIAAEFLGGLGLMLGLLGRVAAFGVAVNMLVATALVHWPNGLFMNWSGQQKGEGFEYHLLAVGIALAVMLRGSGALSFDRAIARRIS